MSGKANLKYMLEINRSAARKLLDDISEDESLVEVEGYTNHVRWEAGHMAGNLNLILRCLTDKSDIPDEWRELFRRGAECSKNPAVYPSLQEIREKRDSLYEQIFEALEDITDEKLQEEIEIVPDWKESRLNGALFFSMHDFYHAGQVGLLRRAKLNREQPFG